MPPRDRTAGPDAGAAGDRRSAESPAGGTNLDAVAADRACGKAAAAPSATAGSSGSAPTAVTFDTVSAPTSASGNPVSAPDVPLGGAGASGQAGGSVGSRASPDPGALGDAERAPGGADPGSGAPLVRARGLACARGGLPVVEGVDLDLLPGEIVALTGPNGAGKTTLLRTLAGLQPPLVGDLSVPPETVVYAGHADGVKGVLTVAENLAFWARIFARPGAEAAAMAAFDLAGLADRAAQNLSAGQRRRLGLARLLVAGRPVWLLDEPTVSLDAGSAERLAQIVADHAAAGGAVLVATHTPFAGTARRLDLAAFRPRPEAAPDAFDAAFL